MVARGPRAQKLGPGELKIGGDELDISCQMTSVKVTWDIDEDDPVPVLCGGSMPGDTTYTAKLEGEAYQDLTANGIVDYTWRNRGEIKTVEFTPSTGKAKITGSIVIQPLEIGGDVGKKNTSDIEFSFAGDPVFTPNEADKPASSRSS